MAESFSRSACSRRSGPESMRMVACGEVTRMDERVRLLHGSVDVQTGQWHPITGTPTEVPVPRKVMLVLSEDTCSQSENKMLGAATAATAIAAAAATAAVIGLFDFRV